MNTELCKKLQVAICAVSNRTRIRMYRNIAVDKNLTDNIYDLKIINKTRKIKDDEVVKLYDNMQNENIKFTSIYDDDYPEVLRYIDDRPAFLFYKGNINVLTNGNDNISIIGSRDCTDYGRRITEVLCQKLSNAYVNTISGGARGIDSLVHKNTLKYDGTTISVLGNGLSVCYPPNNKEVFKEIEKKGCIISEFLPNEQPKPYNFPRRNRIISGLCDKLIVVEGGENSGTSITVDYALNQGKDIYAFPGSIFSPKSTGTNRLIYDGAVPICNFNDIIEKLKIKRKKVKNEYTSSVKKRILQLLDRGPLSINQIIRNSDIDISIIYELLFELQIENEIVLLSGNYYAKID